MGPEGLQNFTFGACENSIIIQVLYKMYKKIIIKVSIKSRFDFQEFCQKIQSLFDTQSNYFLD